MLLASKTNLLIIGIVAQKMATNSTCTAYTVANDYGISHPTARKELTTLWACGFLLKQDCISPKGFERAQYTVSAKGFHFLNDNVKAYTSCYLAFLFSLSEWG